MKIINAKSKLRDYKIIIKPQLIEQACFFIKKYFSSSSKIALITNNKIVSIYKDKIMEMLLSTGIEHKLIVLEDGEMQKNLENTEKIYQQFLDFNMHRNDIVIAFGGGVIGDIAGFAASTFHRGLKLLQFPTTLVAQVDSSMGGKVVVNFKGVKNVIGTFYQPHAVLADTGLLSTLEENEIINGLAEVVKYGIVFDKKILYRLDKFAEENTEDEKLHSIVNHKGFESIIYNCCKIKAVIVHRDEFDTGIRNLLNFGHTFGHAIEKAARFKEINHGMAVAAGMIMAVDASIISGYAEKALKKYLTCLYKKLNLPVSVNGVDSGDIYSAMRFDKKFSGKANKFILLKDINRPFFAHNLSEDIIKKAIQLNITGEYNEKSPGD